MSSLVCLGGGIESVPILERLARAGHRLTVVDGNARAPGFALTPWNINASCYHADQAIQRLRGGQYDGVLCCAVDAPDVAAEIGEAFNLPGMRPAAAALSVDKWAQVQHLQAADVPCPRTVRVDAPADIPASGGVIKPVDSRGARGVVRLGGVIAPDAAFYEAEAHSGAGCVIWQEWLDGPQYSTESIVYGGRVIWTGIGRRNYSRLAEFAPHVIEDGYDALPDEYDGSPSRLIERAVWALGWDRYDMTVKGDLVCHNGRWAVIELAARMSGGWFAEPGHMFAYGLDFPAIAARLALGQAPGLSDKPRAFVPVSQRYIFGKPGRTIRRLPQSGAAFVRWRKAPGHICNVIRSHADRLGMVMCLGARAEEIAVAARDELEAGIEYAD